MHKRHVLTIMTTMLSIIAVTLSILMASIHHIRSRPIPADGLLGATTPSVENSTGRTFNVDKYCRVRVYKYAETTFVNIFTIGRGDSSGIILSSREFHHLRRFIPDIVKTIGGLRYAPPGGEI